MMDPSALSDEQPNLVEDPKRKPFKLETPRMGPTDPFEEELRAAEAGDQQAQQRVQDSILRMPPGLKRSKAQQRLIKAQNQKLQAQGVAKPSQTAPWWTQDSSAEPVDIQNLDDLQGALTGGLFGEGKDGEMLATEAQREAVERGYGIGAVAGTAIDELRPLREKYTDVLKSVGAWVQGREFGATYEQLQQTRDDNRRRAIRDIQYSRKWIDEVVVPGVVDDLDSGKDIDLIRQRIAKTNIRPNRALGQRVDRERLKRHMAQKPADVPVTAWRGKFKPYADAFVSAEDALADRAAALGKVTAGEEFLSANTLTNVAGFFGTVAKNITDSSIQDDVQLAAKLVRENKPVPQDVADRILAYKLQQLRPVTEKAGMIRDFTQSAGYAVDQWLGGKVFEAVTKGGGAALRAAGAAAPRTIGQIARGFGVAADDILTASMQASPAWKRMGDAVLSARTNTAIARGVAGTEAATVGTKAINIAEDVGKAVGAAVGETTATGALTAATSLYRQGDLSETRAGRAGLNALQRAIAEELQVGIDPDTQQMTLSASDQPVSDDVAFSDVFDIGSEFISERMGRYLPIVGGDSTLRAAKKASALNVVSGTVGRGLGNKLKRAATGFTDAVPIGNVFEEVGEEYFKRGLDRAAGFITGDETLSDTQIVGGVEEIVDEFVRIGLNSVLMGGFREAGQFATTRPSERARAKRYEQVRRDVAAMESDPEARKRVEEFVKRSRIPVAEDVAAVVQKLGAAPADIDSLKEDARKRLRDFERNNGVVIVPLEGAENSNGAFDPTTPGVIYVSVDTVNDEGQFEAATAEMLTQTSWHELKHDAQFLLQEDWGPMSERLKQDFPEIWQAASDKYGEALGEAEFDKLSPKEADQEVGAQIAEDNAILMEGLLNNPEVASTVAKLAQNDRTLLEGFMQGLGKLLPGQQQRLARKLRNQLGQRTPRKLTAEDAAEQRDVAAIGQQLFNLIRDAAAVRGAVRSNKSFAKFAGVGEVPDQVAAQPRDEFARWVEASGGVLPARSIPTQEAALGTPDTGLYPGVEQVRREAGAFEIPAEQVDAEQFGRQRAEARQRAQDRTAASQRAAEAAPREADAALEAEVAQAEQRYSDRLAAAEAKYQESDTSTPQGEANAVGVYNAEAERAREAYNQEVQQINQRRTEAERAEQSRASVEPQAIQQALESELATIDQEEAAARARATSPRPLIGPFTGRQAEPQAEAPLPTAAQVEETLTAETPQGQAARQARDVAAEETAATLEAQAAGEQVLRRNVQEVLPGDRVRIRQSSAAYDSTIGKLQRDNGFEVIDVTGPAGNQRVLIQVPGEVMRTVVPIADLRRVRSEAQQPTTEGQRRSIERTQEEARTGQTRFSPRTKGLRRGSGRERYDQGPRQEFVISSAPVRAKKPKVDSLQTHLVVGMDGLPRQKGQGYNVYEGIVIEARRMLGAKAEGMDDAQAVAAAERFVVNNLLYLYDNYEEYRDRAKEWYNGANRIARELASQHGLEDYQAAAALAALSPQKDWDMNVQLARYLAQAMEDVKGRRATPAMIAWMQAKDQATYEARVKEARKKNKGSALRKKLAEHEADLAKDRAETKQASGSYASILNTEKVRSKFLRAYVETTYDKTFPLMSPEGETTDQLGTTDRGTPAQLTFGSYTEVANAVAALDGASIEEIDAMFNGHKVRSFYNNIMYPDGDWGDVTIDTHAVAGAEMMPYGGTSLVVTRNFGSGEGAKVGRGSVGMNGTYAFYATAFRRAAAKRGVLPREMQSITWEAARGMMLNKKTDANMAASQEIWDNWRNGKISQPEALRRINSLYGGIPAPRWARQAARGAEEARGQEDVAATSGAPSRSSTRRSPRRRESGTAAPGVPGQSDSVREDGADANGVVPVVEGAERNKNFQKFVRRSKVRDDKGKPMVVYHGTKSPNDFSMFDRTSDIGYHFGTQDQAQSERFVGYNASQGEPAADYYEMEGSRNARVYPVYLDIRSPLIMPDLGLWPAKQTVDVLRNLASDDAATWARRYARAETDDGTPVSERMIKAFKPIPFNVVEDIINELDSFDGNNWEQTQARQVNVRYMEIIRKHLQNAGYDGIVYVNEAEGDKEAPSYIAFSPHQVKSIHNRGTFDASSPDIMLSPRRRRPVQPMDRFDLPEMTGFERFEANWANRLRRAEDFEDYLAFNGMEVVGDESAVSMMKRYPGRLRAQHQDLTDQYQEPIVRIMIDEDLSVDLVNDYLIARHTEEANRSLAMRRGEAQGLREEAARLREFVKGETDPEVRGPALLEAKNKEARADKIDTREGAISYLTDEQAQAELRRLEKMPEWKSLEEIGRLVDAMNASTRVRLLEGGLIAQEQYDMWERVFDHYVPFRTHDTNVTWAETRGYQDAKPVTQYRQGRQTKPNPLIFSFQQARSGINRAEKNRIGQKFVELLEKGNQIAANEAIDQGMPAPDFNSKDFRYSFSYKAKGEQRVVHLKDADLARVFKNLDAAELGKFMSGVNSLTRGLSNLNTQYNFAFIPKNFARDILTTTIQAGEFIDQGYDIKRTEIALDTMAAIREQLKGGNAVMAKYIEEYKEAGGMIGWSDMTDFESINADIEKQLKSGREQGVVRANARKIGDAIGSLNLAIEQGARVALFKSLRQAGMSAAEAAEAARGITVDFNRRGFYMPYVNAAYMFFNAGVQGTLRSVKSLTSSKTVQASAAAGILLGLLEDMWMASGSDEDEDGRLEWDNQTAWNRYGNLNIGSYKIPLPYFWNIFPGIGKALGRMYRGVVTPTEAALEVSTMMWNSLSPLTMPEASWRGLAIAAAPSSVRGIVETLGNMDYRGEQIYRDPFPGQYTPDSMMSPEASMSDPVRMVAQWLSKGAYKLTGGDPAKEPGLLTMDFNADALTHLWEYYTGGAGKELMRAVSVEAWRDPNRRFVLRGFYGRPNPYGVSSNFYDLREDGLRAEQALKKAIADGDREEQSRIRSEYKTVLQALPQAKSAHKRAQDLNKKAKAAKGEEREKYLKQRDEILGRVVRKHDEQLSRQ